MCPWFCRPGIPCWQYSSGTELKVELLVSDGSRSLRFQVELIVPASSRLPGMLVELVVPDGFRPLVVHLQCELVGFDGCRPPDLQIEL